MRLWPSIFLFVFIFSCGNDKERIKPRVGTLVESVYASIAIQPDSLYQVHAAVNGIIAKIDVEEGDLVSKDERLIQIVNNNPKLTAENARLALDLARENYYGQTTVLQSIKEDIRVARLTLEHDSINYIRQSNLWKRGVGAQNDLDTKKLAFDLAKKKLQLLEKEYDRTNSKLKNELQRAENNYKASVITTTDYDIRSMINGRVYEIYKEPGESVNPQESLASIGSASDFIIEMLVDEVDIAKLEQGMRVIITIDAYEDQAFNAKLTRIYPQKNKRTQTFTAEAVFNNQPAKLFPGLSGEANIITQQKESALIIPREYLIMNNKVKTDNGEIAVEIGLGNMEEVEIVSGLDSDTFIYKPG